MNYYKIKIDIDGLEIEPTSFSIVEGVGKGYNTCTVSGLNLVGEVGNFLTINIDGLQKRFYIDEKQYEENGNIVFLCKGISYLLDDESYTNNDLIFENSQDIYDAVSLAVEINNTIPIIDFKGQNYSKSSTSLSRILDMVAIVKGNAFEINGVLHLEPFKMISNNAPISHTIDDSFGYSYTDKAPHYKKAKQVLINPKTESLLSKPNIIFDYENTMGEIIFNPSLASGFEYVITGLDYVEPSNVYKTENYTLDEESHIKTLAGIDEISHILLNGELFEDYEFFPTHNIVRLFNEISGSFSIKYRTRKIDVNITRSTDFSIIYQCMRIADTVILNVSNSSCLNEIVDSTLTIDGGGKVRVNEGVDISFVFVDTKNSLNVTVDNEIPLASGGNLSIKHRYLGSDYDVSFIDFIQSEVVEMFDTTSGAVIYDETIGEYILTLNQQLESIENIYYGSQLVAGYTYHYNANPPYIVFDDAELDGKNLEISYKLNVVEITIPPILVDEINFLDVIACGGLTSYTIEHGDVMCELPSTFEIDVTKQFNISVNEAKGLVLRSDLGE
ncbi:MAG: hypothetical protein U9O94_09175, partial [Nanoarchaeota archaeon]|nr:hypothetical protein [Nanoarchaeota archaeon]